MVTVNLNLDKKTEQIFLNLEKETNIPKEQYIANVVNGIDSLDDLKDLNDCLMREKEDSKILNSEEAEAFLKSLV